MYDCGQASAAGGGKKAKYEKGKCAKGGDPPERTEQNRDQADEFF